MNWNLGTADFAGISSVDVNTYRSVRNGQLLNVFFDLASFSVPTSIQDFSVTIPDGLKAKAKVEAAFNYIDNGAAGVGMCYVLPGDTKLYFRKGPGNPWQVSTDNSFAQGQLAFEVE